VQYSNKQNFIQNINKIINEKYEESSGEDCLQDKHFQNQLINTINQANNETPLLQSKHVTILLSDLRGFTAMAEKYSALEVIDLLNQYFLKMSEVIQRYNGTIDKFMGDAIMVLFGAPTTKEDDLERGLACAIEMQIAMTEFNSETKLKNYPPLFMGIGINTGEVVAGQLGSYIHSEYTVIGDEVNLASRVEAHSLRGQILISENCYQQAKDFIEIGSRNTVRVKGKTDVVNLYELVATNKPTRLAPPRSEIRKSPRILMDSPLAFQCLEGKQVLPQEHQGRIIDLSYGGIFAVSPIKLDVQQEIQIALSLSLMSHQSSAIYARVIRVNPFDDHWEVNLEFTAIHHEAQTAIKDFVDQQIERI
jgi:adenylate cyclase